MNAIKHAESSVQKFGGHIEDYIPIHMWLDASKTHHGDFRHRALRHHTEGISECEKVFGPYTKFDNKVISVRSIAEQHIMEDCGRLPTVSQWLIQIQPEPWMNRPVPIKK